MLRKVKREAGQDGITSARKRAGTIFKSGGRPCRRVGAPVQFPKVAAGVAGALMRRYNFQKWQPVSPAQSPVWGDLAGAIS